MSAMIPTLRRVLALGGAAAGCGALVALLTARLTSLASQAATAQVDGLVELGVLALGVLVLAWLAGSAALGATCLVARGAGRAWRRGEAWVLRFAPTLVRHTLTVAVAAGLGAASITSAYAADLAPVPDTAGSAANSAASATTSADDDPATDPARSPAASAATGIATGVATSPTSSMTIGPTTGVTTIPATGATIDAATAGSDAPLNLGWVITTAPGSPDPAAPPATPAPRPTTDTPPAPATTPPATAAPHPTTPHPTAPASSTDQQPTPIALAAPALWAPTTATPPAMPVPPGTALTAVRPTTTPTTATTAPPLTVPPAGAHAASPGLAEVGTAPPASDEPAAGRTIVVVRGDTLWGIAARHLAPGATNAQIATAWPRWYAANVAVIGPDPNLLLPGQELAVPAEALR